MTTVVERQTSLKVSLGGGESGVFDTRLPVLAGASVESLFDVAGPAGKLGPLTLFRDDGWLLGAATVPLSAGLEECARQLYGHIVQATRGWHLARIWNYIPAINETGPAELENYRIFCRGRSLAFEEHFGSDFKARLPSASAVGNQSTALTVAFAASSVQPRHVENPLQVPAYDYPDNHGPRAPSFARATVVPGADRATVFISGTAAIKGHATFAPDNLREQLACSLENLREVSRACGFNIDQSGCSMRHFKIYLRCSDDLPLVTQVLADGFLTSRDRVSYLQADLCRASLLVELEATLFGVNVH